MTDYATILRNLGYKLQDRGSYWQTSAIYRDGDNNTAISIYKDSGVWTDFVEGARPLPFELLLKKTLKTDNVSHIIDSASRLNFTETRRELLKEEKIFPESCLKKLLPDFDYFKSRGVTEETQKAYKAGLATSGKLYRRTVFPVYREDGKIHGFSGRKIVDNNGSPKWLHYGKSADWFYPYFTVKDCQNKIDQEKTVFLVESIGDSMALYQEGVENNIVIFGNVIKPRLVSRLSAMNCKIVLSLNNDNGQNRGFDGALTSVLKLIDTVDLENIWFFPPPVGDFGDLLKEDGAIKKWRQELFFDKDSHKISLSKLIEYAPKARISKSLLPKVSKLKKELDFLYN